MPGDDEVDAAWRIGVFDAHCHPTDITDSIERIGRMKAKVLAVMSTRSQDQELVRGAAERYPVESKTELQQSQSNGDDARYVIPAFGWHPWFSHQMYDDRQRHSDDEQCGSQIDAARHYKAVLTPSPDDNVFLASLQPPISFSKFLKQTEARLLRYPLALVGEIGLDRGFRLPVGPSSMTGDVSQKTAGDAGAYTPGSREGRALTPYKVSMEHQKTILRAQLELAAKHQRPVSVHSVQAHGAVFEVLQGLWKGHERPSKRKMKKRKDAEASHREEQSLGFAASDTEPPPYPPRICMHSYSGPQDALRWFLDPKVPADIFFSFSECINFGNSASAKVTDVIKSVPQDRILIESDLHCAGDQMDQLLQDILQRVCSLKGWSLQEGARVLKQNWGRFVFGD